MAHIVDSKSMNLTSEDSCQEEKSRFQKGGQIDMYMSHTHILTRKYFHNSVSPHTTHFLLALPLKRSLLIISNTSCSAKFTVITN